MVDRLKGKVAIVSGGATGMGGAASRLFAAEGAKVAIIDRNEAAARQAAEEIRAAGHVAEHWVADVSEEAAVIQAVKGVESKFGAVTVLFNHAGTIVIKPFLETTLDEWEWLHAVSVRSMFLMTWPCCRGCPSPASHRDRSPVNRTGPQQRGAQRYRRRPALHRFRWGCARRWSG